VLAGLVAIKLAAAVLVVLFLIQHYHLPLEQLIQ
jgi:hypothetical protein